MLRKWKMTETEASMVSAPDSFPKLWLSNRTSVVCHIIRYTCCILL